MQPMQLLLIEDEETHCNEYKRYVSTLDYPHNFYITNGEAEGLRLAQLFSFDIIILDLELHESDGDGIIFLKKLRQYDLKKTPFIIVITNNPSTEIRKCVRQNGADYIFLKVKPDYSPKLVVDFAYNYFLSMFNFQRSKPKQKSIYSIEDEIRLRINKIINDDIKGKNYLIDAIAIVAKSSDPDINLKNNVYPKIAKKYSKSEWSIEKAIDTAIKKAWCVSNEETLAEYYTAVVSVARGSPTNKEFIFYFANQIKEECKA